MIRYIKSIITGIWHLCQGMYITMLNFVRPKVTEQYPENRGQKVYPERFRAMLTMSLDSDNNSKCTACGICVLNCPNGTINIISKMVPDPVTGRERKVLDKYEYNLGSCIFCALCTTVCPTNAIEFTNEFEHAVFTKECLVMQLNHQKTE